MASAATEFIGGYLQLEPMKETLLSSTSVSAALATLFHLLHAAKNPKRPGRRERRETLLFGRQEELVLAAAYFTRLMLCIPALKEIPAPAACGTHHTLRTHGCRLLIILCPRKSMSVGLTCVAAYNAPE